MTNIDAGLLFNASIDLTPHNTPPGIERSVAIDLVTKAVENMPGAGSAGVEWYDHIPAGLSQVTILQASDGMRLDAGARARLTQLVSDVVRKALFTPLRTVKLACDARETNPFQC